MNEVSKYADVDVDVNCDVNYITGVHAYGDTEQRTSVYSTVSAVYICKTHTYNTILTTTPLLVSKYQEQTKYAHTKRMLTLRS